MARASVPCVARPRVAVRSNPKDVDVQLEKALKDANACDDKKDVSVWALQLCHLCLAQQYVHLAWEAAGVAVGGNLPLIFSPLIDGGGGRSSASTNSISIYSRRTAHLSGTLSRSCPLLRWVVTDQRGQGSLALRLPRCSFRDAVSHEG